MMEVTEVFLFLIIWFLAVCGVTLLIIQKDVRAIRQSAEWIEFHGRKNGGEL